MEEGREIKETHKFKYVIFIISKKKNYGRWKKRFSFIIIIIKIKTTYRSLKSSITYLIVHVWNWNEHTTRSSSEHFHTVILIIPLLIQIEHNSRSPPYYKPSTSCDVEN